ncbi:MAG: acyltransferase [Methanomicrobium sp.]|nr:acyltransferase [Methanomicrobium sp.]
MNERFSNNFDFLRFFAASLIIFSHSFALLLGYSNIFVYDWHLLAGQAGLATLLVISGYLIPGSWERKPSLKIFFKKRILRIAPGLLASVLLVIFLIGPLVTSLTTPEYFLKVFAPSAWISVPFYADGSELGLFASNPVSYVNAPLWAIPFEFLLYGIVAFLAAAGLFFKKHSMIPFILGTILLWMLWYENPALNKIRFAVYFFIGAWLYINKENFNIRTWMVLIPWIFVILSYGTCFMFLFAFIAIPCTVIRFAYIPSNKLWNFGRYGDFSFGMFIYAYPLQQTIIHFIPEIQIPMMILLSYAVSIPAAVISWQIIEKRALLLK